jgi:hypothetical protein
VLDHPNRYRPPQIVLADAGHACPAARDKAQHTVRLHRIDEEGTQERLQRFPRGHAAAHDIAAQGLADGACHDAGRCHARLLADVRQDAGKRDGVVAVAFERIFDLARIGHDHGGMREFLVRAAEMRRAGRQERDQVDPPLHRHRGQVHERGFHVRRRPEPAVHRHIEVGLNAPSGGDGHIVAMPRIAAVGMPFDDALPKAEREIDMPREIIPEHGARQFAVRPGEAAPFGEITRAEAVRLKLPHIAARHLPIATIGIVAHGAAEHDRRKIVRQIGDLLQVRVIDQTCAVAEDFISPHAAVDAEADLRAADRHDAQRVGVPLHKPHGHAIGVGRVVIIALAVDAADVAVNIVRARINGRPVRVFQIALQDQRVIDAIVFEDVVGTRADQRATRLIKNAALSGHGDGGRHDDGVALHVAVGHDFRADIRDAVGKILQL